MKCCEVQLTALEDSGHPEHESAGGHGGGGGGGGRDAAGSGDEPRPRTAAAAGSCVYPVQRRVAQINT